MHKTLFLSLLALTLFLGCTKKKKDTYQYTSSEYFTCFINGQEWVAQSPGGPNNPAAITASWSQEHRQLTIFGIQLTGSVFQKVAVLAEAIDSLGVYNMTFVPLQTYGFIDYYPMNCDIYYYDTDLPATVTINEFDSINHHVAGTFQMTLHNPDCPDSIMTITNGKFASYYH